MVLFRCTGGTVALPDPKLVLVDAEDGGNLIVNPQREIWDRSELSPEELTKWCFLVTATARAMMDVLPQLEGGCVNYWDAGNWALNFDAPPQGPKFGPVHRRVHMHLLGRSRNSASECWKWGEAPVFPKYSDRIRWASDFRRLKPEESARVIARLEEILRSRYGFAPAEIAAWGECPGCGYPNAARDRDVCEECSQRSARS